MAEGGLETYRFHFKVVTPLFLGGAEPNERAELRPPSIKGMLRDWYRVLVGTEVAVKEEAELFGGTAPGIGQSPFLLAIDRPLTRHERWERQRVSRDAVSGLNYLGYSLILGQNDRKAIPSGQSFELRAVFPRGGTGDQRRALLASLWLLSHLGGLGTRSRRGFGSLALKEWQGAEEAEELDRLPLIGQAANGSAAAERLGPGLALVKEWYPAAAEPSPSEPRPPGFRLSGARFVVMRGPNDAGAWAKPLEALEQAGAAMQRFRRVRGVDGFPTVQMLAHGEQPPRAPARTAFGLPLTYRTRQRTDTFEPYLPGDRVLWRLAPEMLRDLGFQAPYLPADSRSPDHSVWDHTRVASAAAYLVEMGTKTRPAAREPWMLALTLGGVQRFLQEARKTRDLWTASMIYADLAWAAMRPIVEDLGPDAILYPDLRGNPSADRWLLDEAGDAVPEPIRRSGATSYAAMLPNTFVALVPRGGGDSGLPDLKELVGRCTEGVSRRWRELAAAVEEWLVRRTGRGAWKEIWSRQVKGKLGEPRVSWTAVPWPRRMNEAGRPALGPALPGQSAKAPAAPRHPQLQRREEALSPWLPDRVWVHYEVARLVFWQTEAGYLTQERGFDYPLVHHQLRAALAMRKAAGQPRVMEERGEKCSLTGREEVLHNGEAGSGPLVTRCREGAREFWKRFDADGLGDERLGSTAVIKRYLGQARERAFTRTWESEAEARERGEKEPRVPFPSTAAIAAASFLEGLAERSAEPVIATAIRDYVAAFDSSGLEETVDPRSLAALARAGSGEGMSRFLAIEPEYLFPETLEVVIRRAPESRRAGLEDLRRASSALRDAATKARIPPPRKLVAVLRMDGDALGWLILGDPEVISTTWEDVLHPKATEQIKAKLGATGWPGLLGERRHTGPALHAAISRSLADFAHKVVAWVVEREFNGRLVYAGGDDLLALLPAAEALRAAARLQQLFSAPYVLDTDAHADPWAWRRLRDEPPGTIEAARQRFRVPEVPDDTGTILLSERRFERHADGDPTSSELPEGNVMALYPMLGRGRSLSAGITIGHYKTPLSLMLRTAGDLLEREAKHRMNRGALAVTLLSRSGTKVTFAAKWLVGEEGGPAAGREVSAPRADPRPPDIQVYLRRVLEGFSPGSEASEGDRSSARPRLAGRMPYKLREQIEKTGAVLPLLTHRREILNRAFPGGRTYEACWRFVTGIGSEHPLENAAFPSSPARR